MTHDRFALRRGLVGAALLLLPGCPESGLKDYDEGYEPYPDDTPDEPSGPPQVLLDECPTLCMEALMELAPLGCNIDCDVNLGTTYVGDASVTVLSLLTIEADGEFQTGGSCDVVVDCGGMDHCLDLALTCMDDSSNEIAYCMDEYLGCNVEGACQELMYECYSVAEDANADCMASGAPDCAQVYEDYLDVCNCAYDDCVGSATSPECEEGMGPPPVPSPAKTGPAQWTVSRRFIQRQLDRIGGLATETFLMVMPNGAGAPTALALRSIQPGDALFQVGLRDGDLLLEVGDHPIVELIESPLPLLDLVDAPKVKLTVRRNGVNRQHEYVLVP